MSASTTLPFQTAAEALPRKRFTREEVERLLDTDFFTGQRLELIDGDLIDKMGQKPRHAFAIRLITRWLASVFPVEQIQIQLPIEAAGEDRERSVPEPDIAVLSQWKDDFRSRHPRGDELLLVVEVSDTSASFDLSRKAALYARAGVPEYWVLDLVRRVLVVHRMPDGLSAYRLIQLLAEADSVSMNGRAENVRVGEILPETS